MLASPPTTSWLDNLEGESVTATVTWAKSITFTVNSCRKTFFGACDDNNLPQLVGKTVQGKFFVPNKDVVQSPVSFQATSFSELLLIEVYAKDALIGVFKGEPLGSANIDVVDGSATFQT